MRSRVLACGCASVVALIGCQKQPSPVGTPNVDQRVTVESAPTVVTTTQDVVARSSRTNPDQSGDYTVLVGAYRAAGARGETGVATAVFDQSDSADRNAGELASFQLQRGWAYVIAHPPRWPIVRTPRVRGGVPVAGSVDVYVLAYVDDVCERIVYIGASGAGAPPLTVDVNQMGAPSGASFTINPTYYAERKLDLSTGTWGPLTPGAFPVNDVNSPQELRDLIRHVQAGTAAHSLAWPAGLVIP